MGDFDPDELETFEPPYFHEHVQRCDISRGWRGYAYGMTGLVRNLYQRQAEDFLTDVTFNLQDGSQLKAHKVILALASPVFEAQLFGALAQKGVDEINITDVDSDSFQRVIQFVYLAEDVVKYGYEDANIEDYWRVLEAAHLYILPDLIDLCQNVLYHKLFQFRSSELSEDLIKAVNEIPRTTIGEDIMDEVLRNIINNLPELLEKDLWKQLNSDIQENILDKLEKARYSQEIVDCFNVLQNLVANLGTNNVDTAEWSGKICRQIQTLVKSGGDKIPDFNFLIFYNRLIDWLLGTGGQESNGSSHREKNWFEKSLAKMDSGGFLKFWKSDNGNAIDKALKEVLVTFIVDETDLKLRSGEFFHSLHSTYDKSWTMLEFAHRQSNDNLIDQFELLCAARALDSLRFPFESLARDGRSYGGCDQIIEQINKASQSNKYRNLLHFNILILIQRYEKYPSGRIQEYFDKWSQLKKEALDEIHAVYKRMKKVQIGEDELLRVVNMCKENLNF